MSMEAKYYLIIGYDLTSLRDELYTNEFSRNDDNIEKWEYNQHKGEIQLFSDLCNEEYLYFGYIVSNNDEYDFESSIITLDDIETHKNTILAKLLEAFPNIQQSVIPKLSIISFCDWS